MIRNLSLVLVLATACGSKQPTATPPATTADHAAAHGDAEHHGMDHDMSGLPPELAKFHDVLAPRWHADKGAKRMADTCAALPDFHSDADALTKTAPPSGAKPDDWTTGAKQLVDALGGLDTTCNANDAAGFETAFAKVHESFHGMLAAAGMKMDGMKHDGMDHGGMAHGDHHQM